jgi:hypothetical protein
LWVEDPQEYVRTSPVLFEHRPCFFSNCLSLMRYLQVRICYDLFEEHVSSRAAASELLSTLCQVCDGNFCLCVFLFHNVSRTTCRCVVFAR